MDGSCRGAATSPSLTWNGNRKVVLDIAMSAIPRPVFTRYCVGSATLYREAPHITAPARPMPGPPC